MSETPKQEHVLVCISASPSCKKVIRDAAKMAHELHAKFSVVYIEGYKSSFELHTKETLDENLSLAENLGARITTICGDGLQQQIINYVQTAKVTKIMLGCSRIFSHRAFIAKLNNAFPDISFYVIPLTDSLFFTLKNTWREKRRFSLQVPDLGISIAIFLAAVIIAMLLTFFHFGETSIVMVFLLGILFISLLTSEKIYGLVASLISVLTFNYFFIPPYYSLQTMTTEDSVNFFVLVVASFITSTLTMKVKMQAKSMTQKAYRTQVLLDTSQELQQANSISNIYDKIASQILKLIAGPVGIFLVEDNTLGESMFFRQHSSEEQMPEDFISSAADFLSGELQVDFHTLPKISADYRFYTIQGPKKIYAVVAIYAEDSRNLGAFGRSLLMAMLGEASLALEKEELNVTNTKIAVQARQAELQANLLRSISHDLRTPLTSISGNANILLSQKDNLPRQKKQELCQYIYDDSLWLVNLVEKILSITRIENGGNTLNLELELVEDVIQEALKHVNRRSQDYKIQVHMEDEFLMAKMDSGLICQVIVNLVENAVRYTPAGTSIDIYCSKQDGMAVVKVADTGGGIPDESKERLFEMFYTVGNTKNKSGDARRGLGLGLGLCKSIIQAHGGTISVEDNHPHGTIFLFTLQAEEMSYE